MSARDDLIWRLTTPGQTPLSEHWAGRQVDAYRAEVLREAVGLIDAARAANEAEHFGKIPHFNRRVGMREATAVLRREYEPQPTESAQPVVPRATEEKTTATAAAVTPQPSTARALAEADANHVASLPRHIGRHWHGHDIENACPCPKAPCGLVVEGTAVPECTQHPAARSQTIRQSHLATACPAAEQPVTGRQSKLLAAIQADPGRWGTGRAERLYRVWGVQHARRSARCDLAQLCDLGHLVRVGPDHAIRYELKKDGSR